MERKTTFEIPLKHTFYIFLFKRFYIFLISFYVKCISRRIKSFQKKCDLVSDRQTYRQSDS